MSDVAERIAECRERIAWISAERARLALEAYRLRMEIAGLYEIAKSTQTTKGAG